MKTKSIGVIILALVLGLAGGYFIFGGSDAEAPGTDAHDHSEAEANQLWTCSMHPQILREEPGDCPICGMDLIPAETNASGLLANQFKLTENALALANIQTLVIGDQTEADAGSIRLSGKIATNAEEVAVQSSYFDGRLERLNMNYEGQQVRAGQQLATIYAPNLVAAQQELITAASLKSSQPALYNAVRKKLKLWKLSEAQINRIEESGKVQEYFPVFATVSGTVTEVMAAEGDYVKQGQPLLKLSNLNSVWAEFDAYENQLSLFKKGQKLNIQTNAYPGRSFEGVISFIDPILNTGTRTVTVRATLTNREDLFKPGMFVTAMVEGALGTGTEALAIPATAVMWTGERSLVYVKPNPTEPVFEMREVTLGPKQGDTYAILEGLAPGEEIVVNGTFTVDAAAQLNGKKSMMGGKDAAESEKPMEMNMSLPAKFETGLKAAIPAYLKLKDAFVASDAAKVSASAKTFRQQLQQVSAGDLGEMEKSHYSKLLQMLNALVDNTQLENQREHFVILNENLAALVNAASTFDQKLFLQRCPMANENKGAVWLSDSEQIKNPYYGDAMLGCGSVIETFGQ
ncbi:efflux RND transporter periplasmic adaptor subunit [Leeuwenhoekiella sp. H156]|uniref:efflux RND transporter periplasmic adaptor subunit n=1 Tax=Leeuwenhoekiella sp. H156 TaxID=3450128 RepID=UPI003FA4287A